MTLLDRPVRDLLMAFSSNDPTPGGGSASALASAVGASLLLMVAALPRTRANTPEDRAALDEALAELTTVRQGLANAVDDDTAAYDRVVAAYKMPKASAAEQQERRAAVQSALQSAIDVPLDVMRLSARAMQLAVAVAAHGHRAAASDVGVAAALLRAGAAGAQLNVEINLQSVTDASHMEDRQRAITALGSALAAAGASVDRALEASD